MILASPLARATLALSLLAGCSLINAPDEINPGTGGAGATGGGGSGPGPGGGGSGGGPTCTEPGDCASLTTECADGDCQMGTCVAVPRAAGTACGPSPTGECDLADTCDGAGQCTNLQAPDGTFCADCPAGPGLCGGCEAGTCSGCPSRATTKTFRHPLSASGWVLTGGWRVYSETPPAANGFFNGPCRNGLDDDGDNLIDLDDPGCVNPQDLSEFEPGGCNNAVDDDGDGFTDLADPDCLGPGDDDEFPTGPIRFAHPVLGTDGNRAPPYGYYFQAEIPNPAFEGGEFEQSTATSPPTRIPANLEFLSWHMDEGSAFDLKAVQVSNDGVSFTTVAICPQGLPSAYPFCAFSSPSPPRPADAWDFVSIPVPPEFVDTIGHIRFVLDTKDSFGTWERGWYVDALNFAQDCACASAADCGFADAECGAGTCDTSSSECTVAPQNLGASCSTDLDMGCAGPVCGDHGLCENRSVDFDGFTCDTCSTPPCDVCAAAQCLSCPVAQTIDFLDLSGWTFTGDMGVANCLSPNSVTPTDAPCFPNFEFLGDPLTAPVLGSNGSRTGLPAPSFEVSSSTMQTAPTVLPASITFKSWHQDRGGNDTFVPRDTKLIRVSVNGGGTFTTILNCDGNDTVPFCIPSPPNQNRPLDQWDDVSLPVPANLQGQTGIVQFVYDTVDSGEGWERGWYVDDLNLNTCDCKHQCPGVP